MWQTTDTNCSFHVHSNYSLQNKFRGHFKRTHNLQITQSAKGLPSHCTKSEATEKAATELQPEPGDYLDCWKRTGKNHYSREWESGSMVLNRKLSTLQTPPRTKTSEKMRTLQSALFMNKSIPQHGWVIQAVSFTLSRTVKRQRKELVSTGVLPNAGSQRHTSCSAVTPAHTSLPLVIFSTLRGH